MTNLIKGRGDNVEEAIKFGNRLRELRKKAGLSLRKLARKIDVDFSYISKLENGQLPPPSEPVISRLAEILHAEKEELLELSGRIPSDIAEVVKTQAIQEFGVKIKKLRKKAKLTQQEVAERVGINATYLSKIETGVMPPPTMRIVILLAEVLKIKRNELIALAGKTPVNIAKMRKKLNARSGGRSSMPRKIFAPALIYRVALVMFLVIAFSASLWYASPAPVKAVDINITNPSTGTLGSSYTFTVRVDVQDTDVLPIQSVDLRISKLLNTGTYTVTYSDLPLPTTPSTTASRSYTGAGGSATISGTTGPGWIGGEAQAAYGYRYGYGYGYQNQTWETIYFGYGYGYGYGYGGSYQGATYITYTVVWVPPSSWPAGTYEIEALVYGTSGDGSKMFTNDDADTFVLSAASTGGGGGGGGGAGDVTRVEVDPDNKFVEDTTAYSADSNVIFKAARGTRGETATGVGLTYISIKKMTSPPDLPEDTNRLALIYDLTPSGAQFPDGATLTMKYNASDVMGGTMVMSYWDGSAWVDLDGPFEIDEVNHTISTTIYHFTPFTVIEYIKPAAFTTSQLVISPTAVDTGDVVNISVTVANTGDLSGQYDVVLKVDNAVTETKKVTVAGHDSLEVNFLLSQDVAGTYTISIDGLSGTLTVTAPTAPPPTSKPTTKPTPTTTPTPTKPSPTSTPTPTTTPTPTLGEPEEGWSIWLTIGIVVALLIIGGTAMVIILRRRTTV